jgi:hypothetical protein
LFDGTPPFLKSSGGMKRLEIRVSEKRFAFFRTIPGTFCLLYEPNRIPQPGFPVLGAGPGQKPGAAVAAHTWIRAKVSQVSGFDMRQCS